MRRVLASLAFIAVAGWLGVCALLYFGQDAMLYHPTAEVERGDAEPYYLESDGHRLKAWRVGAGRRAVLYFGGNSENVARNVERFANLLPDTTFYLLNYRGYGGSEGEPDEQAFYRDAVALYDDVARSHDRIGVIGRSLGSGVATWLAAERPVEALVLVTPYDSIEAVARMHYPFVPVGLLLRDKYRSSERSGRIGARVLILVAEHDDLVPPARAMALAASFPPAQVRVRTLDGTGHNSISRSPAYLESLQEFLAGPAGGTAIITSSDTAN